jgi:hypothetical protein
MSNYVIGSYSAALLLLFLCIIFLRMAVHNPTSISTFRILIRLFGIVPGFGGVLFGLYMQFKLNNPDSFPIMTAWLLLELGAVQLLYILKRHETALAGSPDSVN